MHNIREERKQENFDTDMEIYDGTELSRLEYIYYRNYGISKIAQDWTEMMD